MKKPNIMTINKDEILLMIDIIDTYLYVYEDHFKETEIYVIDLLNKLKNNKQ